MKLYSKDSVFTQNGDEGWRVVAIFLLLCKIALLLCIVASISGTPGGSNQVKIVAVKFTAVLLCWC